MRIAPQCAEMRSGGSGQADDEGSFICRQFSKNLSGVAAELRTRGRSARMSSETTSCKAAATPLTGLLRWAALRRSMLLAWFTLAALGIAALALARLLEETNYDAVVAALF